MASFNLHRRDHDRLQHAVNTETDAQFFFVRLDVNVAGAALHRIRQNQVHQLDDRRFFGGFLQVGETEFRFCSACSSRRLRPFPNRLHHLLKLFFFAASP